MQLQMRIFAFSRLREFLNLSLSDQVKSVLNDPEHYIEGGIHELIRNYLKAETEITLPASADLNDFLSIYPHYQYEQGSLFTRQPMVKEERQFLELFYPQHKKNIRAAYIKSQTSYLDLMKGNVSKQELAQQYMSREHNLFVLKNRNKYTVAASQTQMTKGAIAKTKKEIQRLDEKLMEASDETRAQIKNKQNNYRKMLNRLSVLRDQWQLLKKSLGEVAPVNLKINRLIARLEKLMKGQDLRSERQKQIEKELEASVVKGRYEDGRKLENEFHAEHKKLRKLKTEEKLWAKVSLLDQFFEKKSNASDRDRYLTMIFIVKSLVVNITVFEMLDEFEDKGFLKSKQQLLNVFSKWTKIFLAHKTGLTEFIKNSPDVYLYASDKVGLIVDYKKNQDRNVFDPDFIYRYMLLTLKKIELFLMEDRDPNTQYHLSVYMNLYEDLHEALLDPRHHLFHEAFHLADIGKFGSKMGLFIRH